MVGKKKWHRGCPGVEDSSHYLVGSIIPTTTTSTTRWILHPMFLLVVIFNKTIVKLNLSGCCLEISIIFQTIDERTISNSYIALDLYLVTNLMTLHFSKKTKEFHFIFFFFLLPNGLFVNWLVTCNPYSLFQVIELRPPETKNPILQRAANHANSHS